MLVEGEETSVCGNEGIPRLSHSCFGVGRVETLTFRSLSGEPGGRQRSGVVNPHRQGARDASAGIYCTGCYNSMAGFSSAERDEPRKAPGGVRRGWLLVNHPPGRIAAGRGWAAWLGRSREEPLEIFPLGAGGLINVNKCAAARAARRKSIDGKIQ